MFNFKINFKNILLLNGISITFENFPNWQLIVLNVWTF